MSQARILPLLGPAAVLYLVADVASAADGLSPTAGAIAAVAVLASLSPLFVRHRRDDAGARRVGVLGVATGLALVAAVRPDVRSYAVDVTTPLALAALGAILVDLCLSVPDTPRPLDRGRWLRTVVGLSSVGAALAGLASVLPVVQVFGRSLIVPVDWRWIPVVFTLAAGAVAVLLRGFRRRMGSAPEALASNTWALLGAVPAVGGAALALGLVTADVATAHSDWVRGLLAFAAAALVTGHLGLVDTRRRVSAGPATRRLVATALTLGAVATGVALIKDRIPEGRLTLALWAVATLLVAAGIHRALVPTVERLVAPFGARLLRAVRRADAEAVTALSLLDLGRAVLGPMRAASADPEGEPLLYTIVPAREIRVDAAGEPHVREQPVPQALADHILEHPGDVIVRTTVERLMVRRPDLRPLGEVLVALDALCVVPLSAEGETEGAIVLPRGRRRGGLSLEELSALQSLGTRLSGLVAILGAQARADRRANAVEMERRDLEDRLEAREEELERLRADARVLKAGRAADRIVQPPVAYSPPMRELMRRVEDVAPMDGPVLLVGEPGTDLARVAHAIHEASGRSEGPVVVADCGAVSGERSAAALFGEDGEGAHPGWLRLAAGGTLLLTDVPALSPDAQRQLAEALGARQARAVDGAGAYPVDVRVVATSRLELEHLVDVGAFDSELVRWLSPLVLRVPALRERPEDIGSLVLLAVNRACRVLGREPLGVDEAALEVLARHDWPGNRRELQWVIDRAVARAAGPKIHRDDLPPLAATGAPTDPLEGSYADIERRVLTRALERTDGNKSAAARLLGMKRRTFLDKLRRHDVGAEGTASEPGEASATAR